MAEFQEIAPENFKISPFKWVGNDWLLIAAEKDKRVNAMTASWGTMGVLWQRNVAIVFIRPHRYTYEFVEGSDTFSLNFFEPDRHKMLEYFGSTSGRDEDKIATAGLTVTRRDGAPYFAEAKASLLCRKLYAQPLLEELFIDKTPIRENYPLKDFHTIYVGEVLRILAKPGSLD